MQQLIETLQLTNVFAEQLRAEQAPAKHYDFVVARGVTNWRPYTVGRKN